MFRSTLKITSQHPGNHERPENTAPDDRVYELIDLGVTANDVAQYLPIPFPPKDPVPRVFVDNDFVFDCRLVQGVICHSDRFTGARINLPPSKARSIR
jgi:hypothetical protein